jgi:hypothetical protein
VTAQANIMHYNNRIFAKLAIAGIIIQVIINAVILCLSFNDLLYLNKIVAGETVTAAEQAFFIKKENIQYWVNVGTFLLYMILFLIWFYRAYSNVYMRESNQAPVKRGIVPFCTIIPIANLFVPYQVMKFICWGNAHSVDHLNKGYSTINLWWGLSIISVILNRVYAFKVKAETLNAIDYINLTYLSIAISIICSCAFLLTRKLIIEINRAEQAAIV